MIKTFMQLNFVYCTFEDMVVQFWSNDIYYLPVLNTSITTYWTHCKSFSLFVKE